MAANKSLMFFPELPGVQEHQFFVDAPTGRIEPRSRAGSVVDLLAGADAFLTRSKSSGLLAVYFTPEFELAHLIGEGRFHEGAIEELAGRFEQFLGFVRKHPRSILLVDYEKAERSPDAVAKALADRSWGAIHGLDGGKALDVNEVARALARLAILESPALRRIGAELEAREAAAFPSLHNQSLSLRAMSDLGSLLEENQSVTAELFRVQDDLQQAVQKREVLEATLSQAQGQYRSNLLELQGERDRLKKEISRYAKQEAQRKRDLEHMSNDINNLRSALNQVYGSTSWRVSAPLRWLRTAFDLVLGRRPASPPEL